MAMKLASAGPTRQRSVSCRLRRRPSISEQRPVPGRATVSWPHAAAADEIAMFGSADLQRHGRAFEIVDVVRAVLPAALRGAERGAARRADRRVVIDSRGSRPSAGAARSRASPAVCRTASAASCWLFRRSLSLTAASRRHRRRPRHPGRWPCRSGPAGARRGGGTDRRSTADASCSSSSASPCRPGTARPRPVATSVLPALPGASARSRSRSMSLNWSTLRCATPSGESHREVRHNIILAGIGEKSHYLW